MKLSYLKSFVVNKDKLVLSSETEIFKTENFINQTKYLNNIDFFISKIAETLLFNLDYLKSYFNNSLKTCLKIETKNKTISFYVKLLNQNNIGKKSIIFFKLNNDKEKIRQNDQRIVEFLKQNDSFPIDILFCENIDFEINLSKQYLISGGFGVNLPKLSTEQKTIVETENKNMLVQGVAGSGKTNVCLEKLIFVACKEYAGKILYTTFSRGLLLNTKLKLDALKNELNNYVEKYKNNKVVFVDSNHKKALENKFGIYFFDVADEKILLKIEKIIKFIDEQIDFYLLEDLYKKYVDNSKTFINEQYFINNYVKNIKNHQITKELIKIKHLSLEIIYKEIFGLIFGNFNLETKQSTLGLKEYIALREGNFTSAECTSIYMIAQGFEKHCAQNNLIDNNIISKELLNNLYKIDKYSLAIVDEVQDYSQITLYLIKQLALKVFCVGDALQMINPTYFSFGYLKNLLFEKDVVEVAELVNNYRNTKKIEHIIENLGEINTKYFGTHNFVLKGKSVDNGIDTRAVYVDNGGFINEIAKSAYDNFTFVVSNQKAKESLRKLIKNQEILTVSEIKGLERDTVVLVDVLTNNFEKWQHLIRTSTNKKKADENSVFRYFFNLFYVGVSRAKQNLFVVENKKLSIFENFFKENFENLNHIDAIKKLNEIVAKYEFTTEEAVNRVAEFLKQEQYENARFTANKIVDDKIRISELVKIEVYEKYISKGNYREAGVKFWENGLLDNAKQQFEISGDKILIDLIDACSQNDNTKLDIDIVKYYNDVKNNEIAKNFILETINNDLLSLKSGFKEIQSKLKTKKNKNI